MKLKQALIVTICTAAIVGASNAPGVEVMTTEELQIHCAEIDRAPKSEDAIFCTRYIQGFIDGAIATDEARDQECRRGV